MKILCTILFLFCNGLLATKALDTQKVQIAAPKVLDSQTDKNYERTAAILNGHRARKQFHYEEAIRLFTIAATLEGGTAEGMYCLATMLLEGPKELQNPEMGWAYLKVALLAGYEMAEQYYLRINSQQK